MLDPNPLNQNPIESNNSQKYRVWLAILLLLFTHIFWAGNIFASKIASDHIPPLLLNFIRWSIAGLILLPFVTKSLIKERQTIKENLLKLTFFGFLGITIYNALLYTAAHTTSGINIAVLSTLTPLCTFLFAWALYKESPNTAQFIGFTIGILGVLILIFESNIGNLFKLHFNLGDLWMFIAVLAWALYTVTYPKLKPQVSGLVFLFCTIALGTLISTPAVIYEYTQGKRWIIGSNDIGLLAYIGIFPSLLSYLFFNYGVSVVGAIKASLFSYLLPIFTALIGIAWLNETLEVHHIAGQILVFIGFYLSVLKSN